MVNGFQKPLYLLEKTRGIPYPEILFAKITINILSVGVGVILLLIEREILARYASLDINFLIFSSGVEVRTLAATIFIIAALFPVLASTIFLFVSSIGGTRANKVLRIVAIGISFIALLKAESWFSGTAELFYLIIFLLLAGSTIYLADKNTSDKYILACKYKCYFLELRFEALN